MAKQKKPPKGAAEEPDALEGEVLEGSELPLDAVLKAPVAPTGPLSVKERMAKLLASPAIKSLAKDGTITTVASTALAVPRVRTHAILFDLVMRGGFPTGVIHHWYGPKSSGKTTLALLCIGVMQKTCSCCSQPFSESPACCATPRRTVCAFINMEGILDKTWAAQLGVDLDLLVYASFRAGEEACDMVEALLASGEVDLVAIDSLAALTPQSELNKAAADVDVGSQARLVHRLVRKTVSHMNAAGNATKRRPTIIFINQIRMKVGVVFGNPETTSAGNGPGFAAAIELRFSAPEYQKDKDDNPLAVTLKPKVEKSKLFPGKGESAELVLAQRPTEHTPVGGILDAPVLVSLGVQAGLVEGAAPNITCLGRSFRGKSTLEMELLKDPGFASQLRDSIFAVMLSP